MFWKDGQSWKAILVNWESAKATDGQKRGDIDPPFLISDEFKVFRPDPASFNH